MTIRKIAFAGVIGALYAALTMALGFIAYGPVQFRVAEALCILPFFFPAAAPGLFAGCLIANLISPYGILDIAGGSFASLLAALLTMYLGRLNRDSLPVKALACAPPVIVNAIVIGLVIAWTETSGGDAFWYAFFINGAWVGFGQLVILYAIGLPLMIFLPEKRFFKSLLKQYHSM